MGTGIVATAALLVPHLPAGQLRLTMPTLWIVLGPLGQSITAANLLGEVAHLELPAPYSSAFAALSCIPWPRPRRSAKSSELKVSCKIAVGGPFFSGPSRTGRTLRS
jgi:hypothetical protein